MKITLLTMLMVAIVIMGNAQDLKEYQHMGTITKNDGSKQEGIIEANLESPWSFQRDIRFFDPALLQSGKLKSKDKEKYDPKDIAGFEFDGKSYESRKYANMTAVGPGSFNTMYFLEVVADGPIKLYKYYESPPPVMSGDFEAQLAELRNNPIILIQKGDAKIKEVRNIDLMDYIEDCPEVAEKFKKGEYGNAPVDENKSGAGKFINRTLENSVRESYVMDVITEYNSIKGK